MTFLRFSAHRNEVFFDSFLKSLRMIFTWYLFWMSSDTVERVVDFSGQSNRRKPQCVRPDSMVARGMDLSYA